MKIYSGCGGWGGEERVHAEERVRQKVSERKQKKVNDKKRRELEDSMDSILSIYLGNPDNTQKSVKNTRKKNSTNANTNTNAFGLDESMDGSLSGCGLHLEARQLSSPTKTTPPSNVEDRLDFSLREYTPQRPSVSSTASRGGRRLVKRRACGV